MSNHRDDTRINQQIRADKVRVVTEDGDMLGIMPPNQALEKAFEMGLDLVEISPNAKPPVCKILDYGKYKYQQQKKAAEARKKQNVIEVKELKMRPNISDHDLKTKFNHLERFLDDGNKVKLTIRFRGREMAHKDLGYELMDRIKEEFADRTKVESNPSMQGRQMSMVLGLDASKEKENDG